jgi:hypothetical protein
MRDRDALRQALNDALRVIGDSINLVAESIEQRHKGNGLEGPGKAEWLTEELISALDGEFARRRTAVTTQ